MLRPAPLPVSYTHLDVYKRQVPILLNKKSTSLGSMTDGFLMIEFYFIMPAEVGLFIYYFPGEKLFFNKKTEPLSGSCFYVFISLQL